MTIRGFKSMLNDSRSGQLSMNRGYVKVKVDKSYNHLLNGVARGYRGYISPKILMLNTSPMTNKSYW